MSETTVESRRPVSRVRHHLGSVWLMLMTVLAPLVTMLSLSVMAVVAFVGVFMVTFSRDPRSEIDKLALDFLLLAGINALPTLLAWFTFTRTSRSWAMGTLRTAFVFGLVGISLTGLAALFTWWLSTL